MAALDELWWAIEALRHHDQEEISFFLQDPQGVQVSEGCRPLVERIERLSSWDREELMSRLRDDFPLVAVATVRERSTPRVIVVDAKHRPGERTPRKLAVPPLMKK